MNPSFTTRVLPVIVIENIEHAVPMAHALEDGGIDAVEITLRTPAALGAIEAIARALPSMHIGAGTILRPEDLVTVRSAGATFALSPGCTPSLADAAKQQGLNFIPGVMTPSEILLAVAQGFRLLKLFPAAQAGGPAMLKALASPFSNVSFCPTGSISAENMNDYLKLSNVPIVGGSWLTPPALLHAKNWAAITSLARQASQKWTAP